MYDFTINGKLNANLNHVFDAFSRPDIMIKWCAPGTLSVSQFHAQLQIDGRFQMVLQSPDGFQQTVVGSYQNIVKNEHLSFTWQWEDTNDITKVEVEFALTKNGCTSVMLSQRGFKREQDMMQQQYSWLACFEKLAMVLKEEALEFPTELQSYFTQQSQSAVA